MMFRGRGQMVKIYVGSKKQKWVVHQNVLCEKSQWFKRVFTCELFKSAHTKEIHLEKVNPKTFEHFIDWSYGNISLCDESHENPADVTFDHVKELLELYIFADGISLEALSTDAFVQYQACSEWTLPCAEEIELIYENTLEGSLLREHAVNTLIEEFFSSGLKDFDLFRDTIACNVEFAGELSKVLKEHTDLENRKDCTLTAVQFTPRPVGNLVGKTGDWTKRTRSIEACMID
jgi:hypothetical protein